MSILSCMKCSSHYLAFFICVLWLLPILWLLGSRLLLHLGVWGSVVAAIGIGFTAVVLRPVCATEPGLILSILSVLEENLPTRGLLRGQVCEGFISEWLSAEGADSCSGEDLLCAIDAQTMHGYITALLG